MFDIEDKTTYPKKGDMVKLKFDGKFWISEERTVIIKRDFNYKTDFLFFDKNGISFSNGTHMKAYPETLTLKQNSRCLLLERTKAIKPVYGNTFNLFRKS